MSAFRVHQCHYLPGAETVTIVVQAVDGVFVGALRDLYTTQTDLDALRANEEQPWGDAEVMAEAAAQLEGLGAELEDQE